MRVPGVCPLIGDIADEPVALAAHKNLGESRRQENSPEQKQESALAATADSSGFGDEVGEPLGAADAFA